MTSFLDKINFYILPSMACNSSTFHSSFNYIISNEFFMLHFFSVVFFFLVCFSCVVPLCFLFVFTQVRTFGSMICMLSNSVFAFISLKTFPILMHSVHLYGVSWICSGVCFFGILFAIFILQETKGKNLNERVPKNTPTTSN